MNGTLLEKELFSKRSNPPLFRLTDKGKALANRLWEVRLFVFGDRLLSATFYSLPHSSPSTVLLLMFSLLALKSI